MPRSQNGIPQLSEPAKRSKKIGRQLNRGILRRLQLKAASNRDAWESYGVKLTSFFGNVERAINGPREEQVQKRKALAEAWAADRYAYELMLVKMAIDVELRAPEVPDTYVAEQDVLDLFRYFCSALPCILWLRISSQVLISRLHYHHFRDNYRYDRYCATLESDFIAFVMGVSRSAFAGRSMVQEWIILSKPPYEDSNTKSTVKWLTNEAEEVLQMLEEVPFDNHSEKQKRDILKRYRKLDSEFYGTLSKFERRPYAETWREIEKEIERRLGRGIERAYNH